MHGLLPGSTLFPYTTLFRSLYSHGAGEGAGRCCRPRPPRDEERDDSCGDRDGADRKSTRLNSSHVAISYAVFCVKQKSVILVIHTLEGSIGYIAAVICCGTK